MSHLQQFMRLNFGAKFMHLLDGHRQFVEAEVHDSTDLAVYPRVVHRAAHEWEASRDGGEGETVTKTQWFDKLAEAKLANGYTPEEVAEYRADLEERYSHVSEAEFAKAFRDS